MYANQPTPQTDNKTPDKPFRVLEFSLFRSLLDRRRDKDQCLEKSDSETLEDDIVTSEFGGEHEHLFFLNPILNPPPPPAQEALHTLDDAVGSMRRESGMACSY
jgi:hypothetical protein